MENTPLVTIQILNWNRADETLRAIKSAKDQTYENTEIIVVDNGSTDDSIPKIKSSFPEVKLIKLDKNYGCPGGRNRGIEFCTGSYIFFCDNDGVLHKDAVRNAMTCILKDSNVAILTGLVKDFKTEEEIDTSFKLPDPCYKETNLFQGGITLHKKFIYHEISMYPDDYTYGGEETYMSMKVLDAGFSIIKCDQVILWHKKSDNARNVEKESIQAWGNLLVNSYQLFPLKYFLLFFVYFFTKYPYYANKKGFLKSFLISTPHLIRRLRKYKRIPIKKSTYIKFKDLHK